MKMHFVIQINTKQTELFQCHLDQMREPAEMVFEITKRIYQFRPNTFRTLLYDWIILLNGLTCEDFCVTLTDINN